MRLGLYVLRDERVLQNCITHIKRVPTGSVVEIRTQTRSLAQNAMLHSLASQFVRQYREQIGVDWHGHRMTTDLLKDLLTAAQRAQETVPGFEEGTVVIRARRTRTMSVDDFSDLIELLYMYGARFGFAFSTPIAQALEEARRL